MYLLVVARIKGLNLSKYHFSTIVPFEIKGQTLFEAPKFIFNLQRKDNLSRKGRMTPLFGDSTVDKTRRNLCQTPLIAPRV